MPVVMASVVKIAATLSFLSPLTILAGVPIAASLRGTGGPGPIDIGISAFVLVCIPRARCRDVAMEGAWAVTC
jgi:hypothetical protein